MKSRRFLLPFVYGFLAAVGLIWGMALASMEIVAASPTVVYVDADAAGSATGLSWTDAYTNLQDALTTAISGTQIWVAEGIYYPDEGIGQINDAVTSTFMLTDGVALYGGFAGAETSLDERDWENHITVFSGDLEQNDITDAAGVVTTTENITGANTYHVFSSIGVTDTAVVDGFAITAGKAIGIMPDYYGGGFYNDRGSPKVNNMIISGNFAYYGGGMYNNKGNSLLTEVTFSGNFAANGGGMYNALGYPTLIGGAFERNVASTKGGGMYNEESYPTLNQLEFFQNSAQLDGGGMYNAYGSHPILNNVLFSGNSAEYRGGGLTNSYFTSPTLLNVIFSNNFSMRDGGGMFNYANSSPSLTNVTFAHNSSGLNGGGMYSSFSNPVLTDATFIVNSAILGGGMYNEDGSNVTIINAHFSANSADQAGGGIYNDGMLTINHSTFSQNTALSLGGAIYNSSDSIITLTQSNLLSNIAGAGGGISNNGDLFIDNTLFDQNLADEGGAIYNYFCNHIGLVINHSTFSQNSGGIGGGIYHAGHNGDRYNLIVNQSTFSQNHATFEGGGLYLSIANLNPPDPNPVTSTITIRNSTITLNNADSGGGIFNSSQGFLSLQGNILSDNLSGGDCSTPGDAVNDNGYNIIEDGSCLSNPTSFAADPMLGLLADNGGSTWTHALLPGSPAIDAIPIESCLLPTDQRGVARPQGAACDIGAFELIYWRAFLPLLLNAP